MSKATSPNLGINAYEDGRVEFKLNVGTDDEVSYTAEPEEAASIAAQIDAAVDEDLKPPEGIF